jgi:DNA topoisomerase-1
MTKLVIVESPAKCAKIQEYLGSGYRVTSSMGHIRALKQDLSAVGIDNGWKPTYEIIKTKSNTVKQLRDLASSSEEVILATDDDREGEGIAFHICALLKLDPLTTKRIVFHSITKQSIQEAINNPKTIDMHKFQSQQTRAMLDMLIGYTISPVLWKQLQSNGLPLSAGRCQTPALKLVLDRDVEIEKHNAKRFWKLTGAFSVDTLKAIEASRSNIDSETDLTKYLEPLSSSKKSRVTHIKESVRTSNAPKPLITSSLQQEASKLYNINPKATMSAAQKLYEAGHITYMRTDNAFLSAEGAELCRKVVIDICGKEYLGPEGIHQQQTGETPNAKTKAKTKAKTNAQNTTPDVQAAHEAIRPTHPEVQNVIDLGPHEAKIYSLIWNRALQSQMASATEDCRSIGFMIDADETKSTWSAEQLITKFLGYKCLNTTDKQEQNQKEALELWNNWSKVLIDQAASWLSLEAEESFTKAAARFTEASLIQELETKGIGRPSTFASLVTTIVERNYVEKSDSPGTKLDVRKWKINKVSQWPPVETKHTQNVGKESNKLQVTPLGRTVAEFIFKNYADIFAYEYTSKMEQELDKIAKGTGSWTILLQTLWDSYKTRYSEHLASPSNESKSVAQNKKRDLGQGISVILSRKGPLLLKEESKEFASLPPKTSFESITLAQALDAYSNRDGCEIGMHMETPIIKKKGPYGFYAEWQTIKVPFKPEDTVDSIIEKIKKKQEPETSSYSRKVGDYTIKQGPYGLYFFKHTLKKAQFITFPPTSDKEKVTAEDLSTLYKTGLEAKKRFIPYKTTSKN